MENYKQVERRISVYDLELPLEQAVALLRDKAEGFLEPRLCIAGYENVEVLVVGWVPLTPAELAEIERRREAAAKYRKTKARANKQRELIEFLKTAKKLGYEVKEIDDEPVAETGTKTS